MTTVVGTLVVGFGKDAETASGSIIAEWDDSKNLDAEGEVKRDFVPGDVAWLLIHHDSTATINAVKTTSGSIAGEGEVILDRTEEMGWAEAGEEQGLRYLPAGDLAFDWYGNAGSGEVVADKEVKQTGGQFPCMADVSYPVLFRRYRLQTPVMDLAEEETFPLRVYIYYTEEIAG